jgi:hypothetical protein
MVEQELTEQNSDANVGERPKGKDSVWRADEPVDVRVALLDLADNRADRLVDERQPDLIELGHANRIVGFPAAS